ncbi:MAG: adenine deaminase [Proteobacteria bacterium]|nr:adenine deaminase [Pseudomonadota bacterium]
MGQKLKKPLDGVFSKAVSATQEGLLLRIKAARGQILADVVIKNARWLDVFSGCWRPGDVAIFDGMIVGVADDYTGKQTIDGRGMFVVPGFIDAHVHIESSMMTPGRFSEVVLPRGTTSVIWDPHEIANVKGIEGLTWALSASESVPLDIFVMVPSCVPSTTPGLNLETSGAELSSADLSKFLDHPRVVGLAEMMNWPGLLAGDPEVLVKLRMYQANPRDGHCPGLKGKDLNAYATAGIHSCHESTSLSEAQEKLSKGIHVLIREGSCAKDADKLLPLVTQRSSVHVGFCSDDRNPLDIEESGHIDCIVNKALQQGQDPVDVFRAASLSAALMFGFKDRGAVAPGYLADLVLVSADRCADGDADSGAYWTNGIQIQRVWKRGQVVYPIVADSALLDPSGRALRAELRGVVTAPFAGKNIHIHPSSRSLSELEIPCAESATVGCLVIGVRPGQIVTDRLSKTLPVVNGKVVADLTQDVIKIAVFERHRSTGRHGVALVHGFGLKCGAIATSINHDCHNVIATGSSDNLMLAAINELSRIDGGIIVVTEDGRVARLPLPIGGLMTDAIPSEISGALRILKKLAREIGCTLDEPFLQLSFLALPVIPSLKVTDRGLVDGETFKVVPLVMSQN